ncbi:hypothetical protein TNIN_371841 [Trichonephila inaurata madagascariensis]|uniref:Uncharacterized protein n=1 Tax=Trichonephila inaurata madagascariensis TaxID=2747483 RepID=A0A8X6JW13_9ARAC|nr:hypothetical protein TNIN_371841 [Trichonephila inaurata madagascariensis]
MGRFGATASRLFLRFNHHKGSCNDRPSVRVTEDFGTLRSFRRKSFPFGKAEAWDSWECPIRIETPIIVLKTTGSENNSVFGL